MKKGFTLLEVMVTSVLLSIVLMGTTSVLAISIRSTAKVTAEERVQAEISSIMFKLKKDIRNGRKISVTAGILTIHGVGSLNDINYEIRASDHSLYRILSDGSEQKLNRSVTLDETKSSFSEDADIRARIVMVLTTIQKSIIKESTVKSYVTCRNVY